MRMVIWLLRFLEDVKKYSSTLGEIDDVTKLLQTRRHILSPCRDDIHELIDSNEEQKHTPVTQLFNCNLVTRNIGDDATIVTNPFFETGVVKLQKGQSDPVTRNEYRDISCIVKTSKWDNSEGTESVSPGNLFMKELLMKKRKTEVLSRKYMDTSFIIGSVAEVEGLWIVASYILSDYRQRLAPHYLRHWFSWNWTRESRMSQ